MRGPIARLLIGASLLVLAASAVPSAATAAPKRTTTLQEVLGSDAAPAAALRSGSSLGVGQHGPDANHLPASRSNVEVVGRLEPKGPFGDVAEGQIADVAVHKDTAYLMSWSEPDCTRGGFFTTDISNPADPKELTFVRALPETYHGEGAHATTLNTASFRGDILAVNNEPCSPEGEGGFDLYDVSNPREPKPLVRGAGDRTTGGSLEQVPGEKANSSHSVFVWQDGAKAYAVAVDNTELTDVDIFDITDPRSPVQVGDHDLADLFPQIVGRSANGNSVFLHDMTVKEIGGVQTMLASYWDAGYVSLNVDDPANPTLVGDTEFAERDPETDLEPPEGNGHQGEFSHDNRYILAADEDFATYRTDFRITTGAGAGEYESGEFGSTQPVATLPDKALNGPTVFGGYGCDADNRIPARAGVELRDLAEGEEAIVVLERGPVGDPSVKYGACTFQEKMDNAAEAGYGGVLIAQRHLGDAASDGAFCGSGTGTIPALCVSHRAMHVLFDREPDFSLPYVEAREPQEGDTGADVNSTATFDGWGYAHLFDRVTGREIDSYAIPEAVDERFAVGFGDLSIHEFATDPQTNLAYAAYYAGGFRVVRFGEAGIEQVGHFIDEGGSNLWGVEQFTARDGSRLIAVSDRDSGLYILRYTGPGAVGPRATPAAPATPAQPATPATPPQVVTRLVNRVNPRSVSVTARRRVSRGRTTITSTGRLVLPRGVSTRQGCTGEVLVRVKAGTRTVSLRSARLTRTCRFTSRVTFSLPRRIRASTLRVQATFAGNDAVRRRVSSRVVVRP